MHPKNKLTALLCALALGAIAVAPVLRAESAPPMAVLAPATKITTEPAPAPAPPAKPKRDVDLVLIIDTSGSMEGLLDSARSRLWDIVNDVAERDPNAHLRVAVMAYGTPHYGSENGYVKILSDLTDNLDGIYGHAMSLTTNGGDEYVGMATHTALEKLAWSKQNGAARIVFVAGNEGADQGGYSFHKACGQARERKIVVNALYAGPHEAGLAEHWGEFARACGGVYTHLDTQQSVVQIAAPQDQQLLVLNEQLNSTYRAYGAWGASGSAAQRQADHSSSGMGASTLSSRIVSKGNAVYDNSTWDLVDAVRSGSVDLSKVPEDQLPAELRALDAAERKAELARLEAERARIQAEILRLAAERDLFLKGVRSQGQQQALDVVTESMLEAQLR